MWKLSKILDAKAKKNKKAISEVIGYVILIGIGISLSVLVYNWLRFYVSEDRTEECPEGVNLIIQDYNCVPGVNGQLNLTLKNKGLFNVSGFIVRVHDREDAEIGLYTFDSNGVVLSPGEEYSAVYNFVSVSGKTGLEEIRFIEVQPFVLSVTGSERVFCKAISSQRLSCILKG